MFYGGLMSLENIKSIASKDMMSEL